MFDPKWRICLSCRPMVTAEMAQAKAIEDDMYPAQKEGHKTGMMLRNPWPEGIEPDYVRLVQDLLKQHDVARQSSAADLVAQARPRQLLLYRRLYKLHHEMPMEGKYGFVPRQGWCGRCKFQQPYFATKCAKCDLRLLFTDTPPDAIDLLPTLPPFKPKQTEEEQQAGVHGEEAKEPESEGQRTPGEPTSPAATEPAKEQQQEKPLLQPFDKKRPKKKGGKQRDESPPLAKGWQKTYTREIEDDESSPTIPYYYTRKGEFGAVIDRSQWDHPGYAKKRSQEASSSSTAPASKPADEAALAAIVAAKILEEKKEAIRATQAWKDLQKLKEKARERAQHDPDADRKQGKLCRFRQSYMQRRRQDHTPLRQRKVMMIGKKFPQKARRTPSQRGR